MSVRCVSNIAIQMITILEYIHNKHIIHRDIKPDNFVIGVNDKSKYIYLLDFGLAKKYRSSSTLKHNPLVNKKNLTGTARYASINALNGFEQSRRDDLEAVGYVLMYFLRGSLPWQGLHVKHKEDRYVKIMEKKKETTPEELCMGYPKMFEEYVSYTRNLEYEEDPNYEYLRKLFEDVLRLEGCEFDYYYDWSPVVNKRICDINKVDERYNYNIKKEDVNDDGNDVDKKDMMNDVMHTRDVYENNNNKNCISRKNSNNKDVKESNEEMGVKEESEKMNKICEEQHVKRDTCNGKENNDNNINQETNVESKNDKVDEQNNKVQDTLENNNQEQ